MTGETFDCVVRSLATLLVLAPMATLTPAARAVDLLSAGTRLEVRLTGPTGSRISHTGDAISALVIAPVFGAGRLLIPQGAVVSGAIESVRRVGLGLKHLSSGIEYRFDTIRLPTGPAVPIETRVVRVETAKERVDAEGEIGGI